MVRYSRRSFLTTVGGGIAVASAGCLNGFAGGENQLETELDTVRSATAEYEDPKQALEDGFQPGGPYVPGMGWHFTHPGRLQEAAENGLDLEKPPMLTYLDTDDGLKLGSAEFGVPEPAVEGTPDLFSDGNAEAAEEWHGHEAATHVFANGDGEQNDPSNLSLDELLVRDAWTEFSPPDESIEAGDTVALNWGTPHGKEGEKTERVVDLVTNHPPLKTLHAWVHAENPEGVFSPVNPEYGGDGHSH